MELSLESNTTTNLIHHLTDLDEAVKTMKWEEIGTFSSKIVHSHTKSVLLGDNMYIMTQAQSMANTYTEMTTGSRCVAIVFKNQTAVLIIISKGIKVTQVVALKRVLPVEVMPGTLEKLNKMQGI